MTQAQQEAARAAIKGKLSTFRQALTAAPSDRSLIGAELARLLGAFPTQDLGVSAALRVEAYREAISDAPLWAVREARLRIVRGQVGAPHRFAPSPPELCQLVDDAIAKLRRDLWDLEHLAEAEFEELPPPRQPEPPGRVNYAEVGSRTPVGRFDKTSTHSHTTPAERAAADAALKLRMEGLHLKGDVLDAVPNVTPRDPDGFIQVSGIIDEGLPPYFPKED